MTTHCSLPVWTAARRASLAVLLAVLPPVLLAAGCRRGAPPPAVPEVETHALGAERVLLTTDLPGRTAAHRVAEVRPQVSGTVLERHFTDGARVRRGQLLYRIDPVSYIEAFREAEAAHAAALADLSVATARAERVRELVSRRSVGPLEEEYARSSLLRAQARAATTRARLERASIDLARTEVVAPISGHVGRSGVEVGAVVSAQQDAPLTVIEVLDPIDVEVSPSLQAWLTLQKRRAGGARIPGSSEGERVRLLLDDGTSYPLGDDVKLEHVDVDPANGSVRVRVAVANPDQVLLPGMRVVAVVEDGVADAALLVPDECLGRDPEGRPFALVVRTDDIVERRALVLGGRIGDRWLVREGLAAGDEVVVGGLRHTSPGDRVRAVHGRPPDEARRDVTLHQNRGGEA